MGITHGNTQNRAEKTLVRDIWQARRGKTSSLMNALGTFLPIPSSLQ